MTKRHNKLVFQSGRGHFTPSPIFSDTLTINRHPEARDTLPPLSLNITLPRHYILNSKLNVWQKVAGSQNSAVFYHPGPIRPSLDSLYPPAGLSQDEHGARGVKT